MIHIKDHRQKDLFDPWGFLSPKRRELLDQSWAGLFQKELLCELPVGEVASFFNDDFGCPTKELHTVLGALILQQAHDLTDDETVNQLAFNIQWHYALNGTEESDSAKYICPKTLWNMRSTVVDHDLDATVFDRVTDKLAKVYADSVFGGKLFIREALDNLKEDVLKREEVSHRRALQTRYEAEEILQLVSEHFGIRSEELIKQKGDERNLIIHLLKNKTGMTNRAIGEFTGGLSYSGVSRVEVRFVERLKKDRSVNKDLKAVFGNQARSSGGARQRNRFRPVRFLSGTFLTDDLFPLSAATLLNSPWCGKLPESESAAPLKRRRSRRDPFCCTLLRKRAFPSF